MPGAPLSIWGPQGSQQSAPSNRMGLLVVHQVGCRLLLGGEVLVEVPQSLSLPPHGRGHC
jgi:hypothetical protein